jgi:hypothetical protein
MLRRPLEARTLKGVGGVRFDWQGDIDQRDDAHASRIADQIVSEGLADALHTFSLVSTKSNDLGKIVPNLGMFGDTPNPLTVKDLMRLAGGPSRKVNGRLTARTRVGGPPGAGAPTTTFDADVDFILHYELEYRDLPN